MSSPTSLRTIAFLFLKLGTISFGGPAAHIALMEEEFVRRRRWLTHEEFLDLLSAANLIPGPNSTEMAIHIGHRQAGWKGLVTAGVCFITPAVLLTALIGQIYLSYGSLPAVQRILYGVKPVILAVIAQAVWMLGRSTLKTPFPIALAALAFIANFAGWNELAVIGLAGAAGLLFVRGRRRPRSDMAFLLPTKSLAAAALGAAAAVSFSLDRLFFFFLKVGSVLFGSGYVLLAFLRTDLVDRWGWLTEAQLLDAVAVGQFTPGPVFSTATFIGYILGGGAGAAAATAGIFLPAFFFVAVSAPFIPRLRRSARASGLLDGLNAASLAVMAVTACVFARSTLTDLTSLAAVALSFALLRMKINSAWLVLTGGAVGFFLTS